MAAQALADMINNTRHADPEPVRTDKEICRYCAAERTVYTYYDGTVGVAGPPSKCGNGLPHRWGPI